MGDGVLLAQIVEQRGHRCEPVADRAAAEAAPRELIAPGDDVRARNDAKFLRAADAGEAHEVADRGRVGAARARVAEVGEPLDLGRRVGELMELGGGEQPGNTGRRWGAGRSWRGWIRGRDRGFPAPRLFNSKGHAAARNSSFAQAML
jgi:hypothetical protein